MGKLINLVIKQHKPLINLGGFFSLYQYYIHIATESQESFPHLKLLQEYVFGKPKEVLEVINEEVDGIDYNKLTIETLRDLANNTNDKPDES